MSVALTIQQPWASALFAGRPVESRARTDGRCPYPQLRPGMRLLVHAGLTEHARSAECRAARPGLPEVLPMGVLLGSVHLLGWLTAAEALAIPEIAPWVFPDDPTRWYLRHDPGLTVVFGTPIPCRGAQGVWDVAKRLALG